ncbi:unnamed protein product, partial [Owenia fusiformis]
MDTTTATNTIQMAKGPLINNTNTEQMEGGPPINYTKTEAVIIGLILAIIAIMTIFGNILVIGATIISQGLKTKTRYFIVSLATADILVAVLVMPFGIYQQVNNLFWDFGDSVCKLSTCFDIMFSSASIYNLLCIAIDRYMAICMPFHYHNLTKKIILGLLIGCWTMPIPYSFLAIFMEWNLIGIEEIYSMMTSQGNTCIFLENIPYALIASTISFFLPMIALIGIYTKIFYIAIKQSNQIAALNAQVNPKEQKNMKHEKRAAKSLAIIVGVFLICWLPFFTFNILDPLIGYKIPFVPWMVV